MTDNKHTPESEKIIQSVTENELREYAATKKPVKWVHEPQPTYNPGADAYQIAIIQNTGEADDEIIPAFAFGKTIDQCMERANIICSTPNLKADHDQLKAQFRETYTELEGQRELAKKLVQENEKVKRLLHDLTPGGSEFYDDPEYCAKWIRKEREECAALQRGTIKELKAELEAAKQREAKLREALQPLANLDLTGVTGGIVYQRDSTYIKVADVQKAKEALNQ